MSKACQEFPLVLSGCVHGGGRSWHRASVGRVLCKMLLPQKEEQLPHIAVRAIKNSGISRFFFSFHGCCSRALPRCIRAAQWVASWPFCLSWRRLCKWWDFPLPFSIPICSSFFLFASFLSLRESCLNLQGTCQDDQDREEGVINKKGGKRNSGFSKGALVFLCRSISSKVLFFPAGTGSCPNVVVVFNPSSGWESPIPVTCGNPFSWISVPSQHIVNGCSEDAQTVLFLGQIYTASSNSL